MPPQLNVLIDRYAFPSGLIFRFLKFFFYTTKTKVKIFTFVRFIAKYKHFSTHKLITDKCEKSVLIKKKYIHFSLRS